MPSDLQITNIKDQANANSAITIGSDGQITVNQNNPTITLGSNATGFTGIKVCDQWRLTASYTTVSTTNPITTSNIERKNNTAIGHIGSAMLYDTSTGIFTFPTEGIYLIEFGAQFYVNDSSQFQGITIDSKISGTSSILAMGYSFINRTNTASTYTNNHIQTTFDVVDTSTHKAHFRYFETAGGSVPNMWGSSTSSGTTFTFTRIGDT